jgi:FimV-like protein
MRASTKFLRFLPALISFLFFNVISVSAYAELVMANPEPQPQTVVAPPKEIPANLPPADALLLAKAPTEVQVAEPATTAAAPAVTSQAALPTPEQIAASAKPETTVINAETGISSNGASPNLEISAAKYNQVQNFDNIVQQVRLLNERVSQLENANVELQKQLSMTGQYFVSLEQGISDIQKEIQTMQTEKTPEVSSKASIAKTPAKLDVNFNGYFALNKLWSGTEFRFFISIVLVLFLFGFWKIIAYRKHLSEVKNAKITPNKDGDNEGEYDFLGGDQGIEPRLNLARAYIDMGNKHLAQDILEEILVKGNDKQKFEAEVLLKKIV